MSLEGMIQLLILVAGVIATPVIVAKSETKIGTALAFVLIFWVPLIVASYWVCSN